MDIKPILEDLEAVEPDVEDQSLKDLLKQLFTTFKQLSDTLTGDGAADAKEGKPGELDIPGDAVEVSPLTGDSLENPDDAGAEKDAIEAAGTEKEEDDQVPGSGLGDEIEGDDKDKDEDEDDEEEEKRKREAGVA